MSYPTFKKYVNKYSLDGKPAVVVGENASKNAGKNELLCRICGKNQMVKMDDGDGICVWVPCSVCMDKLGENDKINIYTDINNSPAKDKVSTVAKSFLYDFVIVKSEE